MWDREVRRRNRRAINAEIERELRKRSAKESETLLVEAGVSAGRVLTVPEGTGHAHLAEREFISVFEGSTGTQKMTRGGFVLPGDHASPHGPAKLSEHTEAWLDKLGYDQETVLRLRQQQVLDQASIRLMTYTHQTHTRAIRA